MSEIISKILAFLMSVIAIFAPAPNVGYTPLEGRAYTDGTLNVVPDTSKHIVVTVNDSGTDIFTPSSEATAAYRYGPTVFVNADGSLDVWFAAPGSHGQWDWITYKHSPNGGESWTNEIAVLQPTARADDFYSCCDPGIVKIGSYYYLGYTSTTDLRGVDNQIFVARSLAPQGPYEKWNGSGWGGVPKALISYHESPDDWGAGEPSFVVDGDRLFVYYTWKSRDASGNPTNETRVAVANAKDENWPLTLEEKGVAITYTDMSCDSADVKFIDDFGKFVAVSTSARLGENSYVSFYESNDGLHFTKACDKKTNIAYYCHNSGISSRPDGHIRLKDKTYLAYAYGPEWGHWATRLHAVTYSLADSADFSDSANSNAKLDVIEKPFRTTALGITTESHYYIVPVGSVGTPVKTYCIDTDFSSRRVLCNVHYSDYDNKIIKFVGNVIVPLSEGETYVTAEWNGLKTVFLVRTDIALY